MGEVAAIIVAAGSGTRMGSQSTPKQFLEIGGRPILAHTLKKFEDFPGIDRIVLVIRNQDRARCEQILTEIGARKVTSLVEGGKERQESVLNGLLCLSEHTEITLIHDAVRVFVTEAILATSIRYARECGASITAVPVKDTIKQVIAKNGEHFVVTTLDRSALWQVQTPQTFQYPLILSTHQQAHTLGISATDDAMLVEQFGHPVKIVHGSYRNIKITTPDDLLVAEAFLRDEHRIDD
jgi:2-C-methyl-D-erythritol 4-phosphate cytidylyltransferase